MWLYNSFTGKKERFVPREPGKVYMYVCGITAYDLCHIGHARAAVVFDVLYRFLRYQGYDVIFVRNFTDIDDKIINRAREKGLSWQEVAERYIEAFYEDMDKLDILRPTYEPRATEHIKEMQEIISTLIEKGYAYPTPKGDVYFRVRAFKDYGRLSGRDIEELKAGVRVEVEEDKEDPLDFALWKASRPPEPWWESPWGKGRPGWHIECSAMSEKYLGLPLDIHGGGQDLIFPHHENERAQSVAARGVEFVRYWVHNGFVQVNGEKMSKSLGNFVTLRDIYREFLPEVLRFFLLTKHYRTPLDFSFDALRDAEKGLKRIYETRMAITKGLSSSPRANGPGDGKIERRVEEACEKWKASLADDLNTARALGDVFTMVKLANRILQDKGLRRTREGAVLLERLQDAIKEAGEVLGAFWREPQEFLKGLKGFKLKKLGVEVEEIERAIYERQQARREKDFKRADEIRDDLFKKGIVLKDTPDGCIWDVE